MINIIWRISRRNSKVPVVDGYVFKCTNTRNNRKYWVCNEDGCNVRLITVEEEAVTLTNEHEHSRRTEETVRMEFEELIRNIIEEDPFISSRNIYNNAINQLLERYPVNTAEYDGLPSYDYVRSHIYDLKHIYYPVTCHNINDFILDTSFCYTLNQENFLICDENLHGRLIIIGDINYIRKFFITENNTNGFISMDGTFKTAPSAFFQIYIIYGSVLNQKFPLFYAFLENKTELLYIRLLNVIRNFLFENGIDFNPRKVMIDFESAMYNALRRVFIDVEIIGCYFHFGQAIWRKLCALGLKRLYNTCTRFERAVSYISSLPLVPLNSIDQAFIYIKSLFPTRDALVIEFFSYIEHTWINRENPLFDRIVWNHFDNLNDRTNNFAEGFNSKLSRLINKSHPNFYECLDRIKRIQSINDFEVNGLINGNPPRRQKRKYRMANIRIQNTKNAFLNMELNLTQLIHAMSRAIKLQIRY